MIDEAASAGFFTSEHFGKFPRIQILTIEDNGSASRQGQTLIAHRFIGWLLTVVRFPDLVRNVVHSIVVAQIKL